MQNNFGERLKDARREKGFTQEQLAEVLAVSTEFLSRMERGKGNPSLETLIKLAAALNLSTDELLGLATSNDEPAEDSPEIRRVLRLLRTAPLPVVRAVETLLRRR